MRKKTRPVTLLSVTTRQPTAHGTLFVTITHRPGKRFSKKPFEIFAQIGKVGSCEGAFLEAVTRAISLGLRHGVPPGEYVRQLRGIACHPSNDPDRQGFIHSPADGLARVLEDFFKDS